MTTDQLVEDIIVAFMAEDFTHDAFVSQYYEYMRSLGGGIFSVALNDETRDVRFVFLAFPEIGARQAYEVRPETVVRTEYKRV